MLEELIARVGEFEAIPVINEEDELEMENQRVFLRIDWRLSDLATIRAKLNEMELEEAWCLSWLGTTNLRRTVDLDYVEKSWFRSMLN